MNSRIIQTVVDENMKQETEMLIGSFWHTMQEPLKGLLESSTVEMISDYIHKIKYKF